MYVCVSARPSLSVGLYLYLYLRTFLHLFYDCRTTVLVKCFGGTEKYNMVYNKHKNAGLTVESRAQTDIFNMSYDN